MINSTRPTHNAHRMLLGPPLFIIMLFCFGFVLLQPQKSHNPTVSAANQSSLPTVVHPQSQLPALSFADQTPLPVITTDDQSHVDSIAAGILTATPQPTGTSANLQSTAAHDQQPAAATQRLEMGSPTNTNVSTGTTHKTTTSSKKDVKKDGAKKLNR